MRKFFLALLFLGLFAVLATGAAVPLVTRWVAPEMMVSPPPKGLPLGQRDFPLPERSEVAIQLELPLEVLAAAANQHAPKQLEGIEQKSFHPKISDNTLQWRLRPGTVELKNTGAELVFQMPVRGDAFSSGKFGLLRLPVKGSAILGGVVAGRMDPFFNSDWKVDPRLSTSVRVTQADVTFGKKEAIDARDQVAESLRPMLQKQMDLIGPGLTKALNLKEGMQKLWDQAHIHRQLSREPETWVVFDPGMARIGPLDYSHPDKLSLTVGMVAQSFITNTQASVREPENLPPLESVRANPLTSIRVPVIVNFEQLNAALADRVFRIETKLGPCLVISCPKVALGAEPGYLDLGMDVKVEGAWVGNLRGHLVVTGQPIVDCPSLTMGFVGVKTKVETTEMISKASAWLFEEVMIKAIEKEVRIDLKEHLPELENEIYRVVTSLPVPQRIDFAFKKPAVCLLGAYTVSRQGWNREPSPGIVFVLGATTDMAVRIKSL